MQQEMKREAQGCQLTDAGQGDGGSLRVAEVAGNRSMTIKEAFLLDVLGEPNVQFTIPRYQRAYSWGEDQCNELWRDLFRAARAGRTHFAGALIYVGGQDDASVASAEPGNDACGQGGEQSRSSCSQSDGLVVRPVVDGQQRLTTLTLILAALADHLRERGESIFGMGADEITRSFLRVGDTAKLRLSRADCATLESIVSGLPLPAVPSPRVMANLELFRAKMEEDGFDALQLWQGLGALTVVAVELGDRQRAPEVFESLNSKGVPLVTADLVRNYLLLAESHSEQARLYNRYWEPIQGVFGDDPGSIRLNNAILGWLAVRFRQVRKFGDSQAFSIFKSFCEDEFDGTVDSLLDELYAFCLVWAENYRYHAVKKYKTADWAKLGRKTRVSGRPRAKLDHPESRDYYQKHFGVDPQW